MKVVIEQVRDQECLADISMSNPDKLVMDDWMKKSQLVYCGKVDDGIVCLWGLMLVSLLSDQAYLWLYTTELVAKHQFLFVRHSQRIMERLLEQFSIIFGHVDPRAERSMRWLKWLGAEFIGADRGMVKFRIGKK
jgi:hypothetical protein